MGFGGGGSGSASPFGFAAEESQGPELADNAEAAFFGFWNFKAFTLPTTFNYYRISGLEWKNGTAVAGNVLASICLCNANPPTVNTVTTFLFAPEVAQAGVSVVQRVNIPLTRVHNIIDNSVANNIFSGGSILMFNLQSSNVLGLFRTNAGGVNINRNKVVAYAATPPLVEATAMALSVQALYLKIYFQGMI